MSKVLSKPRLGECELAFRINMVKKRLRSYPLDRMNFIMQDLERPKNEHRQAEWCSGDLTGRILEFMSFSDGVTEKNPEWVHELFDRIMRTWQDNGLFGVDNDNQGQNKLLIGLLRYYNRYGDRRALEYAIKVGNTMAADFKPWTDFSDGRRSIGLVDWMTEAFAELYRLTRDEKWVGVLKMLKSRMGEPERVHAHDYLTSMRGLREMGLYSGDESWCELPAHARDRMIAEKQPGPAGDICEGLPWTERNEACATADWIRLNLLTGFMNADDSAYEEAEHAMLNALYFAQIVTGGMGHRALTPWGYGVKEFQEAWWCCTMNGGMAMADMARHAATLDGDTLRINFLLPGTFTLRRHGKPVEVKILTAWPEKYEAEIEVSGETEGLTLHVRVPGCVRGAKTSEKWEDGVLYANVRGEIGYTVEEWKDGLYILRHGAQMLAPQCYTIGAGYPGVENEGRIPEGYRNSNLPTGWLKLILPEADENGFLPLEHDPIPNWTYFEEGPSSITGNSELSVYVDVETEEGKKQTLRFWPLSYAISTLIFYATPIVFRKA